MNPLNLPNNISRPLNQTETSRLIEIERLNKIGSKINSYLDLILSANAELSDFQKLALAIELYKVDVLKEISISGDVDVIGRVTIDERVFVSGSIETTEG